MAQADVARQVHQDGVAGEGFPGAVDARRQAAGQSQAELAVARVARTRPAHALIEHVIANADLGHFGRADGPEIEIGVSRRSLGVQGAVGLRAGKEGVVGAAQETPGVTPDLAPETAHPAGILTHGHKDVHVVALDENAGRAAGQALVVITHEGVLADVLPWLAVAQPRLPDTGIVHLLGPAPAQPVLRAAQHDAAQVFVDEEHGLAIVGDAGVLLLHHVVAVRVAGAAGALELADGRIVVLEGPATIVAPVDDGAAGERYRLPATVDRPLRGGAGVEVRPQLAVAHDHRVRFTQRQAGVPHIQHKLGPAVPEIGQRRKPARLGAPGPRLLLEDGPGRRRGAWRRRWPRPGGAGGQEQAESGQEEDASRHGAASPGTGQGRANPASAPPAERRRSQMRPPWASTISRAMASPRPAPPPCPRK